MATVPPGTTFPSLPPVVSDETLSPLSAETVVLITALPAPKPDAPMPDQGTIGPIPPSPYTYGDTLRAIGAAQWENSPIGHRMFEQFSDDVMLAPGLARLESLYACCSRAFSAVETTVYRVECLPNTRILINESGQVFVQGDDQMLFLNFGDKARAEEFLAKQLQDEWPGAQMKSFEVPKSFLNDLRKCSVPQKMGKRYPNAPQIVDPTKAPDQFGLRRAQIEAQTAC